MGQYPDGLRGPLIIHDPNDPYKGEIDEEVILTVSDWYHSQSIPLVQAMLQPNNTEFRPPIPDSIIVNEGGSSLVSFEAGKTYRFRIISFAALAAAFLTFEGHTMEIIMQDGSYITPVEADLIRVSTAQRYDVIIRACEDDTENYPFLFVLDTNPDWTTPETSPLPVSWNHNYTGYLVGDADGDFPAPPVLDALVPIDDSKFTNPYGDGPYGPLTQTIVIDFNFCFDNYSIPRACFNGVPYVPQEVPTLYTAVTVGEYNTNPVVYGGAAPYIVASGAVVDIVVNNHNFAIHPFHLHGHQFQVLERGAAGAGDWPGYNAANATTEPAPQPASRDVVDVYSNSYGVIRFKADNPGVWLFHCHIEWHVEMGMQASIIEAPELLRDLAIPADHIQACRVQNIPYEGNAAGNVVNPLDTTGMRYVNDPVYTG